MATLHVACAVDGAYVTHSAAMLHSVATHAGAGHRVHVHYLHGPGLPARAASRLGGMLRRLGAGVTFHAIAPERVAGLPVAEGFTSAMWFRILLPELLPAVDRVLYLDVDVLALDAIAPLWELDLEGSHVAAVTNVLLEKHRGRPAALGLEPGTYFNSGVLLLHLDDLRRDGCTAALREYAVAGGSALAWPDQDTLNAVLGLRRLRLHPRWNCMNALWLREADTTFPAAELAEARARPALRHFEGPGDNKPWHAACARPHAPAYLRHRRRTPWPVVPRTGTPRQRARRLLAAPAQCLTAMRPV